MKFNINPAQRITLTLITCSLGAIWANWANFATKTLLHLGATLGFGIILFYIFKFISKKPKNIWNTIISCLIIFLVLNFSFQTKELTYPLLITFVTIFSKFYLQPKNSPIINPTVFGLLIGLLGSWIISKISPEFGKIFISWWGTSYNISLTPLNISAGLNLPLMLMILWILGGLNKWRKLPLLISFLFFNALLFLIFNINDISIESSGTDIFNSLKFVYTTGTIYFFTAIMLVEPKTSPMLKNQQIIYALIAALAYQLFMYLNWSHFDLLAIFTANLYFSANRLLKKKTLPTPNDVHDNYVTKTT